MVKNRTYPRSKLRYSASLGLFATAVFVVVLVGCTPKGGGLVAISEGDGQRTVEFFDSARMEVRQILNQNSYYEVVQDDWRTTYQRSDDETITISVHKDKQRPTHLKVSISFSVKSPLTMTYEDRQQECKRMQKLLREWWVEKKAIDDASNPIGTE